MSKLFLLLIAFEVKHLLADWFLQTPMMVEGKGRARDWAFPLFCHAGVHGVFTAIVMMFWTRNLIVAIGCGLFDIATHFIIDRVKSSPNMFGTYKSDSRYFWWLLGADQAAHHINYYVIIFGYREIWNFIQAL